jgi:hypothetical protein
MTLFFNVVIQSVQQIPQQVTTVTGSMAAVVAGAQKTVTVTTSGVPGLSPAIQLKVNLVEVI